MDVLAEADNVFADNENDNVGDDDDDVVDDDDDDDDVDDAMMVLWMLPPEFSVSSWQQSFTWQHRLSLSPLPSSSSSLP